MKPAARIGLAALGITLASGGAEGTEFQWVNPLPDQTHKRLSHGIFHSESMGVEVGYVVYLPPGYEEPGNAQRRYPVVYYLPSGRLGSEVKDIHMIKHFDKWIRSGSVKPRIYVFVNGGRLSHYDYRESLAETAFVKELIPHMDRTYRTIPDRSGRALEGFSMGGRGAARIMFKYPQLFCSVVPIAGGHQYEKHASENNGEESEGVALDPGNNSWDLARQYAGGEDLPSLAILIVVGTRDSNYEANLAWMAHLQFLGVPFEWRIVPEAPHSADQLYQELGDEIMQFHERCFEKVAEGGS